MNLPGYTIDREIDSGGMATVYLAIHESLQRSVALKVMAPSLVADRTFVERFLREGATVARLNHPNIVTIYDIGEEGNVCYLAAEYLPGGNLKRRIGKGLAPEDALKVLAQLSGALAHAHSKGIIHRDIKPENILFRDDGAAVLTDFGIAKVVGSATLTDVGMSIGTPHYMSPEQAQGKTVDGRSDLYSLGVVFYEMLTGKPPYQSDDTFAIAFAHIKDPVPRLPVHLQRYQTLLDRLMAKNPNDRFANSEAFLHDVNRLLAGKGILKSTDKSGNAWKWAVGGGVLAIVLAIAAYGLLLQPRMGRVMIGGGGGGGGGAVRKTTSSTANQSTNSFKDVFRKSVTSTGDGSAGIEETPDKKSIEKHAGPDLSGKPQEEPKEQVPGINPPDVSAENRKSEGSHVEDALHTILQAKSDGNKQPGPAAVSQPEGKPSVLRLETWREPATGIEFVRIPGGCFEMGDTNGVGGTDERPVHKVCLGDYWLSRFEVTQDQWQKIMQANGAEFQKDGKMPMNNISWEDVNDFIGKLKAEKGYSFRLPTEAEWEYAASEGGSRALYSGGDEPDLVAWHEDNSQESPRPVGSKQANKFGLHDMSGNVWEWCQDWYGGEYYQNSSGDNPLGPDSGSIKVVRGGSFDFYANSSRVSYRSGLEPGTRVGNVGFRLVRTDGGK